MPKTILLADDSVTIRKVVELTFSESEYRVESVGSGQEALDRLEAIQPDLVLADIVMPEPAGYDLCRHVKNSDRPVPVLLLAGTFEPFDEDKARQCGADGHLVKPFESGSLLEKVEALLAAPPAVVAAGEEFEEVLEDLASAVPAPPSDEEPAEEQPSVPEPDEAPATCEASPTPLTEETAPSGPPAEPPSSELPLSPEQIDAIARAVVERLSAGVLREIAWEVVPELAEVIIRERIRELEQAADD